MSHAGHNILHKEYNAWLSFSALINKAKVKKKVKNVLKGLNFHVRRRKLLLLSSSVLGHIFHIYSIFIRFYASSETHVRIRIVQTLAINLLTSNDPS